MPRMRIIAFLFLLLLSVFCFAQTQWAHAVGGTGSDYTDYGHSLIQTLDGGFAVVGKTEGFGAGNYDLFIVKFNSTGSVEWARAVGGTGNDYGYSLIQTSDGGFITSGTTRSFSTGWDLFLVRFSSAGSFEWARTVNGPGGDNGISLIQTSDGGFAIAGQLSRGTTDWGDFLFVKFNFSWTLQWACIFSGPGWDEIHSIIQTIDGHFAVAGFTPSFGPGGFDLFVGKFNFTDSLEWEWAYAVRGTGDDWGHSLIQTSDEGFAVVGETKSFGAGGSDLFLLKFGPTGSLQWARAVGGANDDIGYSLVQTSDGGLVAVGTTKSFYTWEDLFVVKFSSSGALEWARLIGRTTDSDYGRSIVKTSDGGLVVAGMTWGFGASGCDFLIAKLDANGNSCLGSFVSPTVTAVSPMDTLVSPTITNIAPTVTIITPTVTNANPRDTLACANLYVHDIQTAWDKYDIFVFPNLFNYSCVISAPIGTKIEIYDISGRLVWESPVYYGAPGNNYQRGDLSPRKIVWTPDKSVKSGIYFVRAKIGEQTLTRTAILIR